ncbi:T-cell surface glycoprotein CD3 epsilon chain-like [Scomber japonicus]|uniref:T-cell surface glycoprotein CD3 epsilon chain-like n=1 Tax=Scomber japonicus TaxID=13676 RepID=UPI00230586C3|nr:T-cell surface glycoprotein CD3 epsilon chain-like [Scomber japonicus]
MHAETATNIEVNSLSGRNIKLTCTGDSWKITDRSGRPEDGNSLELEYNDDKSGEYKCTKDEYVKASIFVKFRTCDNCIDLDAGSISSIVIGDVVATIVIGVAVYLIASHARTAPVPSNKKSSDRQHLVPNEARATNDHYQPLNLRGPKDTYDELNRR